MTKQIFSPNLSINKNRSHEKKTKFQITLYFGIANMDWIQCIYECPSPMQYEFQTATTIYSVWFPPQYIPKQLPISLSLSICLVRCSFIAMFVRIMIFCNATLLVLYDHLTINVSIFLSISSTLRLCMYHYLLFGLCMG